MTVFSFGKKPTGPNGHSVPSLPIPCQLKGPKLPWLRFAASDSTHQRPRPRRRCCSSWSHPAFLLFLVCFFLFFFNAAWHHFKSGAKVPEKTNPESAPCSRQSKTSSTPEGLLSQGAKSSTSSPASSCVRLCQARLAEWFPARKLGWLTLDGTPPALTKG